jgi:uncharacterized protein YcfL
MQTFRSLFVVIAVMAWSGCGTVPEPVPGTPATDFVNADAEKFVPLDRTARVSIQCTRLFERRQPDGRLVVAANLQNHAAAPLTLEVNCVFTDESGVSINDETPFVAITIAPGMVETVRFTAATPAAKRYAVRVKRAR